MGQLNKSYIKNKIARLEEMLLFEKDPGEIARIKEEIEKYQKILSELMRN